MNEESCQKLTEMIKKHGSNVCQDKPRCKGLVLDYCSSYEREARLLTLLLEIDIPVTLLNKSSQKTSTEWLLNSLTQKACDAYLLDQGAARWGVEAWAKALGMSVPAPKVNPKPAQPSPSVPPEPSYKPKAAAQPLVPPKPSYDQRPPSSSVLPRSSYDQYMPSSSVLPKSSYDQRTPSSSMMPRSSYGQYTPSSSLSSRQSSIPSGYSLPPQKRKLGFKWVWLLLFSVLVEGLVVTVVRNASTYMLGTTPTTLIILANPIVAGFLTGKITSHRWAGMIVGTIAGITCGVIVSMNPHNSVNVDLGGIYIFTAVNPLLGFIGAWLATLGRDRRTQ